MNFPVITASFENNLNLGTKIGFAYSLNTAGSIIGPIIRFFLNRPNWNRSRSFIIGNYEPYNKWSFGDQ